MVGEMSCLSGTPRNADIRAIEDGEVWEMRRNVLDRVLRSPSMRKRIEEDVSRKRPGFGAAGVGHVPNAAAGRIREMHRFTPRQSSSSFESSRDRRFSARVNGLQTCICSGSGMCESASIDLKATPISDWSGPEQ